MWGSFLVAARSKAWVCGRSLARIACSNPAGSWIPVFCDCRVLSDWFGLIIHEEDSYRLQCIWVWLWSLDYKEALAHWGLFFALLEVGGVDILCRCFVPYKTIGSERQSSVNLMPEVATVCVVYCLLSFHFILILRFFSHVIHSKAKSTKRSLRRRGL